MVSEVGVRDDAWPDGSRTSQRALLLGLDQASVMGVELLGATLTWTGLGFLADRWLGTTPWLLAVGAIVGNAAGIYLVWLRSNRMEAASTGTQAVPDGSSRP